MKHDDEPITDDDLSRYYKASKQAASTTGPTADARRKLYSEATKLERAHETKQHKTPSQIMAQWIGMSKISFASAAVIALFAVVMIGQSDLFLNTLDERAHYTQLEVHRMPSDTADTQHSLSTASRTNYDMAYKQYLAQQTHFTAKHNIRTRLVVSEEGWALKSCDQSIVDIGADLLSMLEEVGRVDSEIIKGDIVDIQYAYDGRILGLFKATSPLQC